jgi:hypothetical protein
MKTSMKISSALLISGLFLSTSLVAQAKGMSSADTDGTQGTQPLDKSARTQPVDTGKDTQPIDSGKDTQPIDGGMQIKDVNATGRNQLHLVIEGHDFSIRGGEAGEACAILVGLELMAYPLPGGEELNIFPLLVVAQGQFDESGEFSVMIGYDAKMLSPVAYHLQAVSVDENGQFWTSNVQTLDFSDLGSDTAARMKRSGDQDTYGTDGDDSYDTARRDDNSYDRDKVADTSSAKKADTAGLDNGSLGTHN